MSGISSLEVAVSQAALSQRAVLRNLMQLYLYDFTKFQPEDVNSGGRYSYKYLPKYWKEPERFPFLIQAGGIWAGFALVHDTGWPCGSPAHWMAEFFVLHKFRRQGVGREAAFQVFRRLPGLWRVGQVAENTPAQAFWRRIIADFTAGDYRELVLNGPEWFGPLQEFVSGG